MNESNKTATEEMVAECNRQHENCLYTSTQLYIWKRHQEYWRIFFATVPIVCSGIIGIEIFTEGNAWWAKVIVTISAVIIAAFPSIYIALDFDKRIREIKESATEFKNLQDRFRIAINITSQVAVPVLKFALRDFGKLSNRGTWTLSNSSKMFGKVGSRSIGWSNSS